MPSVLLRPANAGLPTVRRRQLDELHVVLRGEGDVCRARQACEIALARWRRLRERRALLKVLFHPGGAEHLQESCGLAAKIAKAVGCAARDEDEGALRGINEAAIEPEREDAVEDEPRLLFLQMSVIVDPTSRRHRRINAEREPAAEPTLTQTGTRVK